MNAGALIVAAAALVGVSLVVLGLRRPRPVAAAAESGPEPAPAVDPDSPAAGRADAETPLPPLMSLIARPASELQNLRLVGITPVAYARQRVLGLCGGLAAGGVIASLTGRGPAGFALLTGGCALVGWLLPLLGVRDTARKLATTWTGSFATGRSSWPSRSPPAPIRRRPCSSRPVPDAGPGGVCCTGSCWRPSRSGARPGKASSISSTGTESAISCRSSRPSA